MSINFEPDIYDKNWANYEIQTKGHVRVLDDLLHSLDCSRYIEGVGYPININHYSYARYSWEYNYTIEHGIDNGILSDERCQIYRERFNALDKQNEAFAMAHPEIGNYKKSKGAKSKKIKPMLSNVNLALEELLQKTCLAEKLVQKLYPKTVV